MRHHSTSIVGPDIDGNEQAVWAKMFPYHTTPVKDAPPAHPSVGERLGEVAYEAWWGTNEHTKWNNPKTTCKDDFVNSALAVRREVLAEGFADEDIWAADTAFQASPGLDSRKWVETALSAALASRLARARTEGGGG